MKKILLIGSILSILAVPMFASAATVEELQTMVNSLQAQLSSLMAQIQTMQAQQAQSEEVVAASTQSIGGSSFEISVSPNVKIEKGTNARILEIGKKYTLVGKIRKAPKNSPVYFYAQRPDGTLLYDKYYAGQTNSAGNLTKTVTEKITGSYNGIYSTWVTVGTVYNWKTSSAINFRVNNPATLSITVLSPNGGEQWQESPKVTDTLSGSEAYRQDIKWTGAPDDFNSIYNGVIRAYLEKYENGQYITVGRIPPFAYGSIAWVVGVVGQTSCGDPTRGQEIIDCFKNLFLIPPGQYYVRIVNTQTGAWDRSDTPFSIVSTAPTSTPSMHLSLVSGSGASPAVNQTVVAGTANATYFAFKMIPQNEIQKIPSLKITATGNALAMRTLRNIKLYEYSATAPFASAAQFDTCGVNSCWVTFTASDNLLSAPVPMTGTTIYAKADVASGGEATLGNDFVFRIASSNDITAKGTNTNTASIVTGAPSATGISYIVPQKVEIEGISPLSATQVGLSSGQTVAVFKISNHGTAPVYISKNKLNFVNSGSANISLAFKIYSSAQNGGSGDTSAWNGGNGYAAVAGTTGASLVVNFAVNSLTNAERKIDGGSYRYMTIKTSGVAANNDTYQFSVSNLGNVLFDAAETDLGYDGNGDGDLNDTIANLYVGGTPLLSKVIANDNQQSSITVLSPNGGETWIRGYTYKIPWSVDNNNRGDLRVSMDLFKASDLNTGLPRQGTVPLESFLVPDGYLKWTIPSTLPVGDYLVELNLIDYSAHPEGLVISRDKSDSPFSIVKPTTRSSVDSPSTQQMASILESMKVILLNITEALKSL